MITYFYLKKLSRSPCFISCTSVWNSPSCSLLRNISLTQNSGEDLCFLSISRRRRRRRRSNIIIAKSRHLFTAAHILIKTYTKTKERQSTQEVLFINWWLTHTHSVQGVWVRKVGGTLMTRKLLPRIFFQPSLTQIFWHRNGFSSQRNLCQSKTWRKKS